MSPDRWQQIEAVFQSALDLAPHERAFYLAANCAGDADLRRAVEKLLADYESADSFIESPVWTDSRFLNSSAKKEISASLGDETKANDADNLLGKKIGVYRLTREIGRGGMGTVFLAERADGEFSQKVAIKLIKRGMDSDFIVRRFRHERQILASFEHPFIARLLDGGTTAHGLPYFVMEYIEGDTLYNFCDKKRLNTRERLKVFQKICSAVQYAHEKQIIHRDIKPSNILVTQHDVPKLLDFGIAKVLDPELIHESVNPTASMMRLMTPDYASPEQVRGQEITTSSDIYSLGILLYELLTGHRPYNFAGRALHEVSQVICDIAPSAPSAIIDKDVNLLPQYANSEDKFARLRASTRVGLREELIGNLDNIVLKALGKSPPDRYASAHEFSADISRHLRGQAVEAKPFFLQTKSSPIAAPPGGKSLAVLPFKFINLAPNEDTGDKFLGLGLADALIARLSKVRRFVVRPTSSILPFREELTDPIKAGVDLGVNFILDGSIKKAGERLRVTVQLLDVAQNATVWATSIDEKLGDVFTLEDTLSNKVIEVLLPQLTGSELEEFYKRGTDSPEAFECYLRGRYNFNSFTEEGFAKAFVCFHEAIATDPNYALAYAGIADYYNWLGVFGVLPPQECFQPAIEAATKAIELDDKLSDAHASLGFNLHAGNYDWSKAEYHLTRALELNPNNATAYVWYSIVLFTEGRFAEGLDLARRGIELDPLTPFNIHNLGWGFYFARRYDEAIEQYQKLIRDFPSYGLGYYGLSKVCRAAGKTAEAVAEMRQAKKLLDESVFAMIAEAESYAADGQRSEALECVRRLEDLAASRYVSTYQLALVYCYLNDREKAVEMLQKAFEQKEAWLNWMGVEPVFDALRADERFQEILEKIGYHYFFNNFSASNRNLGVTEIDPANDEDGKHLTPSTKDLNIHNETTLSIEAADSTDDGTNLALAIKPAKPPRKAWAYAAIGLVILILTAGIVQYAVRFGYSNGAKTIAGAPVKTFQNQPVIVLPFASDDENKKIVGVGLADAVTRKLGYIKRLTVISSNSAQALAREDLEKFTGELGTMFVVRGTLNKAGDDYSLTAEMINSTDGEIVWSDTFAPSNGDLFALQTVVAEKVYKSLGIEPQPLEKAQIYKSYTSDPQAYELYLIGRSQMTARSRDSLHKAIYFFEQSLEADPNFALGYVALGDAYVLLNLYDTKPPENAYLKAEEAARRALAIDDNLAAAHATLGYLHFFKKRDRPTAELEYRRAIQINPSYAQAHHWFALMLAATGRSDEAASEALTAEKLDPRSPIVKAAAAQTYFYARQYDEAVAKADEALAINQSFVPAFKTKRWICQVTKNYDAALDAYRKEYSYSGGTSDEPGWILIKAQVEALGAEREKALADLERAVEMPAIKNNPVAFAQEVAYAYNAFGEREKALDWLEKAEASDNHGFSFLDADPRLENLHSEPRFRRLLEKLKQKH